MFGADDECDELSSARNVHSLGDANWFTSLDCNCGYWQVSVAPQDRDKTTFVCHSGTYRYLRMPFGLTHAQATLRRTLDIIMSSYEWKTCIVYLDDFTIFSKDLELQLGQIYQILSALHKAGVTLKLRKCKFLPNRVEYLGHVIRPGTFSVGVSRVSALLDATHPRTQTRLRTFLGLRNVYRRFSPRYSHIAAPLNKLLKKGTPDMFETFGPDEGKAFADVVEAVTSPPMLA